MNELITPETGNTLYIKVVPPIDSNRSSKQTIPEFDLALYIGRFEIFHEGHLAVLKEALKRAIHVLVLIGSAGSPRTHRNPFSYEERADMVRLSVDPEDRWRVHIRPLSDSTYNDAKWIADVQETVTTTLGSTDLAWPKERVFEEARIALIGHSKDSSSFYLKMFPQFASVDVPNHRGLSSTPMRNAYFSNIVDMWLADCDGHREGDLEQDHLVPTPVKDFLVEFAQTPEWKNIKDEYDFVTNYKKQWASSPYPPTFVTVDAVVVQSGHVLLVKRNERPSKGLWALPGGFINQSETIEDAMLRELKEKTKIAIPLQVLRGSIEAQKVFDDPNRSPRGRTITHAFLINLKPDTSLPELRGTKGKAKLPVVVGSDDASQARWVPLAEVKMDQMFEDHFHLIFNILGTI